MNSIRIVVFHNCSKFPELYDKQFTSVLTVLTCAYVVPSLGSK